MKVIKRWATAGGTLPRGLWEQNGRGTSAEARTLEDGHCETRERWGDQWSSGLKPLRKWQHTAKTWTSKERSPAPQVSVCTEEYRRTLKLLSRHSVLGEDTRVALLCLECSSRSRHAGGSSAAVLRLLKAAGGEVKAAAAAATCWRGKETRGKSLLSPAEFLLGHPTVKLKRTRAGKQVWETQSAQFKRVDWELRNSRPVKCFQLSNSTIWSALSKVHPHIMCTPIRQEPICRPEKLWGFYGTPSGNAVAMTT